MANTVFQFNVTSAAMGRKVLALRQLREAVQILISERAIEIQRRGDTDGAQDAHYTKLASAGAFQSGDFGSAEAAARAAFMKFDDLIFKLTTDDAVANFKSALSDTCAQFGV